MLSFIERCIIDQRRFSFPEQNELFLPFSIARCFLRRLLRRRTSACRRTMCTAATAAAFALFFLPYGIPDVSDYRTYRQNDYNDVERIHRRKQRIYYNTLSHSCPPSYLDIFVIYFVFFTNIPARSIYKGNRQVCNAQRYARKKAFTNTAIFSRPLFYCTLRSRS